MVPAVCLLYRLSYLIRDVPCGNSVSHLLSFIPVSFILSLRQLAAEIAMTNNKTKQKYMEDYINFGSTYLNVCCAVKCCQKNL